MLHKSRADRIYQAFIHCAVAIVAVSALFPFIYVIGMSMTSQVELIRRDYFVIIPQEPTLEAYRRILVSPLVWQSITVSVLRSVVGPLLTLTFTAVGAFVLARKSLPGRGFLLFLVLFTILFHGGLIPSYLVIKQLGLINSFWALVVPMLVDSFGLLVIKMFIENLPDGLVESARIDGAGEIALFAKIVVPMAAPALAAIGMFNIVNHWNSWFDALIYLNDKQLYPLQLVLRNMLTVDSMANDQMNFILKDSQRISAETTKMATVVIGILPILCVYPFLQKYFIQGMYLGAVKG